MIRLLVSAVLHTLANAVGLLVAAAVLDGFSMTTKGFVVATLLFTIVEVIAGPLMVKIAITSVPALVGGIALVTTLIGLIITNVFVGGLTIEGLSTWVASTVIIWLAALLAGLVLPLLLFKKVMKPEETDK